MIKKRRRKKKETEGKIYSPSGKLAELAKKGQSVQTIEWKHTDGQTDGRTYTTDCFPFLCYDNYPIRVLQHEIGLMI